MSREVRKICGVEHPKSDLPDELEIKPQSKLDFETACKLVEPIRSHFGYN